MSSTNTNNAGQTAGDSVKGVFAAIHGVGEQIRGTVNSGVDSAFNGVSTSRVKSYLMIMLIVIQRGGNEEGIAKNNAINEQGRNEVETGIFSVSLPHGQGLELC